MKSIKKKLATITLAFAMAIIAFALPVMAAGVETWYGDWVDETPIIVTNNNLTPVKTMGVSGTLHVAAGIKGRPDLEPSGCPKIKLTMEIRTLSGTVLGRKEVREDAFMPQVHIDVPVVKGQKLQIFFDVSSVSYNPNQNFRVGEINYSHEIY